jgi:hypothetical protein
LEPFTDQLIVDVELPGVVWGLHAELKSLQLRISTYTSKLLEQQASRAQGRSPIVTSATYQQPKDRYNVCKQT